LLSGDPAIYCGVVSLKIMINFLSIVFGLIIGSFLNVCIYRIPREKSIIWPGSSCTKCQASIRWYDNIPLFSYILLRGKCRNCKEKISLKYPIVEFLTAVLTVLFVSRFISSPFWIVPVLIIVYSLIVLSFIDLEFMIIPDRLSLGILVLGLLSAFINPAFSGSLSSRFLQSLIGAAVGFSIIYFLAVVGEWLFKKEAMGGGDLKLMAAVGAIVGWQGVLSTLFLGSVLGAVYGIFLMIFKKIGKKAHIPFGPFLALATLINLYSLITIRTLLLF
jgi:leader peptidase (prepilin peptidase) / N-methyltransferase